MAQFPKEARNTLVERENNKCYLCKHDNNLQIHHIIPIIEGGDNSFKNLILLCYKCHILDGHDRLMNFREEFLNYTNKFAEPKYWKVLVDGYRDRIKVSICFKTTTYKKLRNLSIKGGIYSASKIDKLIDFYEENNEYIKKMKESKKISLDELN